VAVFAAADIYLFFHELALVFLKNILTIPPNSFFVLVLVFLARQWLELAGEVEAIIGCLLSWMSIQFPDPSYLTADESGGSLLHAILIPFSSPIGVGMLVGFPNFHQWLGTIWVAFVMTGIAM